VLAAFGGLGQKSSFNKSVTFKVEIPINASRIVVDFGYINFKNSTSYLNEGGLKYNSQGFFLGSNYFITKNVYIGGRLGLDLNWVDDESQKKFDKYTDIDSPSFFLGKTIILLIGYEYKLSNSFSINFEPHLGLHNFDISEGSYWQLGGSDTREYVNSEEVIETNLHLLYSLNLGILYRF
jgi:hypothetical protein